MRIFLKLVFVAVLLAFLWVGTGVYLYVQPRDYPAVTVIIPPKTGTRAALAMLHEAGVIPSPLLIAPPLLGSGGVTRMKAGEYAFPSGMSPKQVVSKLVRGEVVVHKFTMPEGWTIYQLRELLAKEELLTGEFPSGVAEGSVFPDTVHFQRGESREAVIARMQKRQADILAKEWDIRDASAPVLTPQEALVLASVVEKETGVASERGLVAGVFTNRLRTGMPLQSDPTVVYGRMQEQGGAPLGRELTTADLRRDTPYNTYTRTGLPPAPICNPGRESLHAVLHPEPTDALYFVATGKGGHWFSATLEEHTRNVKAYRQAVRGPEAEPAPAAKPIPRKNRKRKRIK